MRGLLRLLALLLIPGSSAAQGAPPVVRDALWVRLPGTCWEDFTVERDSVPFFPQLRVFVGRCTTYFGIPVTAAVGLDQDNLLYLLDSPTSFQLLERRFTAPAIDSSNALAYAFTAARLGGDVPWDASILMDSVADPDPRDQFPIYRIIGDCTGVRGPSVKVTPRSWEVAFDAITPWWLGRVSAFWFGGRSTVVTDTRCIVVHGN